MAVRTTESGKHLAVLLVKGDDVYAHRLVNLSGDDYRPLRKELAWKAVAAHPELAGAAWDLVATLTDVQSSSPSVLLTALGGVDCAVPLASLKVPIHHFAWLGRKMARGFGWAPEQFTVQIAVLPPDHAWVTGEDRWEDEDFAVDRPAASETTLPSTFSTEPLPARRTLRRVGGDIRCVFSSTAWEAFLSAAAAEADVERAWMAPSRVHLVDGVCFLLIDGELRELPAAEASRHHLVTHGRDFASLRSELGDRLAAYLHLHPREVGDVELGPYPSSADATVAWNFDACTTQPVVLPIALFGARRETVNQNVVEVAAHGYVGGLLTELDLEVMER